MLCTTAKPYMTPHNQQSVQPIKKHKHRPRKAEPDHSSLPGHYKSLHNTSTGSRQNSKADTRHCPGKTKTRIYKSDPAGSSQAGSGHMSTQSTRPSKPKVTGAQRKNRLKANKNSIAGTLKRSQNKTYIDIGDPSCTKPHMAPGRDWVTTKN